MLFVCIEILWGFGLRRFISIGSLPLTSIKSMNYIFIEGEANIYYIWLENIKRIVLGCLWDGLDLRPKIANWDSWISDRFQWKQHCKKWYINASEDEEPCICRLYFNISPRLLLSWMVFFSNSKLNLTFMLTISLCNGQDFTIFLILHGEKWKKYYISRRVRRREIFQRVFNIHLWSYWTLQSVRLIFFMNFTNFGRVSVEFLGYAPNSSQYNINSTNHRGRETKIEMIAYRRVNSVLKYPLHRW